MQPGLLVPRGQPAPQVQQDQQEQQALWVSHLQDKPVLLVQPVQLVLLDRLLIQGQLVQLDPQVQPVPQDSLDLLLIQEQVE